MGRRRPGGLSSRPCGGLRGLSERFGPGRRLLANVNTPGYSAQQAPTRVVIAGVDMRPTDAVPVAVQGPVKIEADRPLRIQEPLTVRIPVTTSPVPGL